MAISNAEQSPAVRSASNLPGDWLPLVLNNVMCWDLEEGRKEGWYLIVAPIMVVPQSIAMFQCKVRQLNPFSTRFTDGSLNIVISKTFALP